MARGPPSFLNGKWDPGACKTFFGLSFRCFWPSRERCHMRARTCVHTLSGSYYSLNLTLIFITFPIKFLFSDIPERSDFILRKRTFFAANLVENKQLFVLAGCLDAIGSEHELGLTITLQNRIRSRWVLNLIQFTRVLIKISSLNPSLFHLFTFLDSYHIISYKIAMKREKWLDIRRIGAVHSHMLANIHGRDDDSPHSRSAQEASGSTVSIDWGSIGKSIAQDLLKIV